MFSISYKSSLICQYLKGKARSSQLIEVEPSDQFAVLAAVHLEASPERFVTGAVESSVWPRVDNTKSLAEFSDLERAQIVSTTTSETC